jgi:hypothetical protein
MVFQSACTGLLFHQQCMRVLFSPHPHQHLLLLVFLMIVILTGMKWNLSVVLICISFIDRNSEHFFMCFLAIWTSSSIEEFPLVQLPTSLLIFGEFSFLSSLYILVISPLMYS